MIKAKKAKKALKILGMIVGGIALVFVISFAVMWLWNWLMPEIFGLATITYWQGVGLAILGRLLLGGFGNGHGDSGDTCDNKKSKSVKGEFKREFRKEFDKEFDKHFEKEYDDKGFDATYEEWWQKEGENAFEIYMTNKDSE